MGGMIFMVSVISNLGKKRQTISTKHKQPLKIKLRLMEIHQCQIQLGVKDTFQIV